MAPDRSSRASKARRPRPRILLAYRSGRPGAGDYFARMLPVGLGYINAALRSAGFASRLANLSRMPFAEAAAVLARERPDLLGLTMYTFNRHATVKLAAAAKRANAGCFVVVGGPHAAHLPAAVLEASPAVDAVATGEGEALMVDLARCLAKGGEPGTVPGLHVRAADRTAFTGAREAIASLDALPWPAPHHEGIHLDVTAECGFIITSRGCPGRCTFCNTPDFWGTRMRFRSAASVVDEIAFLARERGVLYVSIRDDTFTVHKRRVLELCERLEEAKLGVLWNCQSRVNAIDEERLAAMRRAGCEAVQYGVESGSGRMLSLLAKDITIEQVREAAAATRRVGLGLSIYLIAAVPGETEEDFRATEALLEEIRPHDATVAPLAIYPGTALWEEHKKATGASDAFWSSYAPDTLYAMPAEARRASYGRLARACRRAMGRARGGPAYTRAELEEHKRRLPGCFAPLLASGLAYEADGEAGEGLQEYARILAFEPANPWALYRSASVLLDSGDPSGALLFARELAARHPRHAPGHALVAEVHLAAGSRARARAAALRAARLNPHDAHAASLVRALP